MLRNIVPRPRAHPNVSAVLTTTLSAWFGRAARDLPWRRKRSGYSALVAEAMLQQTQVSRVIDHYAAFMRAFPGVRALACADEQAVLAHWQGLGYYRRARHLHQAARMILREHGGRVPRDVETLLGLPGVGRYTAGAIASIVFDQPAPIVDGNVERVLLRIHGRGHRRDSVDRSWTWDRAAELASIAAKPGVFNEAMMELGATVCLPLPATPRCKQCPFAKWCRAKRMGLQQAIPAPRRRAVQQTEQHHAVIVTRPGSDLLLLEQRGERGMWAGMWQTPTIEGARMLDETSIARALPRLGLRVRGPIHKCGEFTHNTTHRRIRFHVYLAESSSRAGIWRKRGDLPSLPMSNAQRRVLSFARERRSADT